MASLSYHSFQPVHCKKTPCIISCTMQPSQKNIKVVINGATKEIGRAAIVAVSRARGMEVAGAVDVRLVGQDAGMVSGMEEALEVPILNDLTMVLGSISQSKATGVVVDFTDPSTVYDNVKQAAAFGLSSVVYVPMIQLDTVAALSSFCEKASMGCLVAPTLSVGSLLLQQAAISASFHYNSVEIVESRPDPSDLPSPDATQIATNLSDLGQTYNREDLSSDNPPLYLPRLGVRFWVTMAFASTAWSFQGFLLAQQFTSRVQGRYPSTSSYTQFFFHCSNRIEFNVSFQVYSMRHDITGVQCLMPGLILAIRKVVRLKNLIYGLEKFL